MGKITQRLKEHKIKLSNYYAFYDSIKLQTQFEILFTLYNQLPTKQNLEI